MKKKFWWLLAILLVAVFLRLYQLTAADVITDEALIGIRSIGYIDFFASPYQTTPYEWFSDIPPWLKLSFHDHPPLVFLIQHFFFSVFGENLIALRLPSVLAGIISVGLIYLIGKLLFNQKTGLIASLFLAVCQYSVWVSRIGLQESLVMIFCLAAFYFFLKALINQKHWLWTLFLGLALLTKYTSLILLPIFLIYLVIFERQVFLNKKFWLAIGLLVLIFLPVIFYNFKLYQNFGHFDLQFSYLFGQKVAAWKFLPGKILMGSFSERLRNLIPNLYQGILWPLFGVFVISLVMAVFQLIKEVPRLRLRSGLIERSSDQFFLLILAIFCHVGWFLVIGPTKRFLVMIVPFIILLIAWFIQQRPDWLRKTLLFFLAIAELFFTSNTLLAHYPFGWQGITYSYLKTESYSWGYNQLDSYLDNLLKDEIPAVSFKTDYHFLEEVRQKALTEAIKQNKKTAAILLIYDENMYDLATLWLFHRRLVYQGWPIVTADTYLEKGKDFWVEQGIKDFYFFKIIDLGILQQPEAERTNAALLLTDQLLELKPEIIKRPDGREVFAVYHWQ